VSYVIAAPELMSAAATDLAAIGSEMDAAHTAAAASTTGTRLGTMTPRRTFR
jgi:PE family